MTNNTNHTPPEVIAVDRLDLACAAWDWPFARERAAEIVAHFERLKQKTPELWNGRVLMLRQFSIENRVFRGRYFETDFAALIAWRDWEFPDPDIRNSFAMGALRSSDGAFILGEMGGHTANAGKIYFAAGTPDREDIRGDTVDLQASVIREVKEELGLTPDDYSMADGWITVMAAHRVAQMKLLQAREPAEALRARIMRFLERERQPELADIHIVRGPQDVDTGRMPPFMAPFLRYIWSGGQT